MSRIIQQPNKSFLVQQPNGVRTFIPPLTLKPLPPSKPFRPYVGHGFVKETGVQGHTLPAFSWNNMDDVRGKRFPSGTALPNKIINDPPDQGNCGSCWIVSAVSMTSDRLAISSLSPPKSLNVIQQCCDGQNGCDGGDASEAFSLMDSNKLSLDQCNPYNQWCSAGYHCPGSKGAPPECNCSNAPSKDCPQVAAVDSDSFVAFYVSDPAQKIAAIQDEIFQNGPVVVGFMVTDNLVSQYACGPKNDTPFDGSGNPLGGHAVVIVGWGKTSDGQGYWVVRNSWGSTWNGDGYWNFLWNSGMEDSATGPVASWTVKWTATSSTLSSASNHHYSKRTKCIAWMTVTLAIVVLLAIVSFLYCKRKMK